MTILTTLTSAGTDSGPFNLYSNIDGYTSAFATGVSKASLLAGYSGVAPDGTTIVRVASDGVCTGYVDISIVLTTTTTTTIADPATSILTFSNYESGVFTFTLSNPIPSSDIIVRAASVDGFSASDICAGYPDKSDNITLINAVIIGAGTGTGNSLGSTPMNATVGSYLKTNSITVDGYGTFVNGNTFIVGGTTVTVVISSSCSAYVCNLYMSYLVKVTNLYTDICSATPTIVYTAFGEGITTGTIVYTDSLLNTPITGDNYILDPFSLIIYNINTSTGLIGASTGVTCPGYSTTTTTTSPPTTTTTTSAP